MMFTVSLGQENLRRSWALLVLAKQHTLAQRVSFALVSRGFSDFRGTSNEIFPTSYGSCMENSVKILVASSTPSSAMTPIDAHSRQSCRVFARNHLPEILYTRVKTGVSFGLRHLNGASVPRNIRSMISL